MPSSVFVALFQCYLTVFNRYSCTSFRLVTNFYKERINSSLPELEPNTTFFCLQRSYLLNLGKLQWSCSSSPNPKSQLVRYPNREKMGNNDRQWCVIVFCDQWGNTLRAAPTLLSFKDAGLFPLQDAMLTRCFSTLRAEATLSLCELVYDSSHSEYVASARRVGITLTL